jgi:glycerol uptake facilitator-like aquaporin
MLVNDTELPKDWALIKFNKILQNESQAVITEAFLCCALLLIAYMTIVEADGKNPFGPMLVGIFVAASIYAAGPLCGAGINPARSFGPAFVFGEWETAWIYFAGPFLGTTVAGFLYRYILSKRRVPCLKLSTLRNIWADKEDQAADVVVVVDMETTV